MTKKIINALDRSAAEIAFKLAPAVIMQNKTKNKKPMTFRDEIKQTLTCTENRPFIQNDIDSGLKIENISKTKEQIDYLTDQVISRLDELGVKHN